ncbi:MAG: flagellar motor switch protein FliM [Desulfatiglans sp.]|jgi:flagellar motor switch protein FliM|nr:flagellar motor switch protein FliM [Desulfatiglans sp.]
MNKLLSQDEVDSLLKGLDAGDIDSINDFSSDNSDDVNVDSFDWAIAGLNVRGNMPLLEVVNSKFSQKLRGTLSNSLRKMLDITPDPLETIKYSDFQKSLPVPTSMHLFKMEPLRGIGIIVVESRLVFSLVEAYFGGKGIGATKIEGREFTVIENRIIEKVVHMALNNLAEAWEDVHPLKTEFLRSESNPLVVNVIPGEELMISTKYEVELTKVLGNIIICFPYASYQPIRHKLAGDYRDEAETTQLDRTWIEGIEYQLRGTEVTMNIDLGKTQLSVGDFLNLREGDILILDKHFKQPLIGKVEDIKLFEGFAGRYKNNKVFKVERPYVEQV